MYDDFRVLDFIHYLCGIEKNFLVTLICELFKLFPFVSFHVKVFGSLNISETVSENTYYKYQSNTDAHTFLGIFYNKPEISSDAEAAFDDQETKPKMQPWIEKEWELVIETRSFLNLILHPKTSDRVRVASAICLGGQGELVFGLYVLLAEKTSKQ